MLPTIYCESDSDGLAFKAYCGLVARDNDDRRAHHQCPKNGVLSRLRASLSTRTVVYNTEHINIKTSCASMEVYRAWDNAVMESFYSRLKVELIYAEDYQNIEEARMGICSQDGL